MVAKEVATGFTAPPQHEGFVGMTAAGTKGFKAFALATVAGFALAGGALAQPKPSPQGAPQQALPTAKPPPAGAPMQEQPARPAAPAAPRAAAPAAPQAIPANEPAAITRLRGLMGPEVRLSYASAQTLDGAGEQVRLSGVVVEQPGKRATAEELLVNGLREDGVAEAVLRGFATSEAGTDVRIASIRLAGLTVPRDPSGAPPEPDKVRLDQLRIEGVETRGEAAVRLRVVSVENWAAGQAARFSLEGLELGGLDAGVFDAMRLARFAISGIDFGGTLGAVMRQQPPPNMVGRAAVELDGLELTAGGRPAGALREVRVAADVTRPDGSGTGTIAFRGIRLEPTPLIADWLTRFGYQAIDAEITADTTFDAPSGRIEIRDLSIAGRDVGTLTFALTMDGVTQERAQAGDFEQMRLISAGLRYADASLFRRFIAMQAREARTPEPQLREQFAAMVGGTLSQPGAAGLDPIRDAVQRFIRGQAQSVEIRVNPPQPIKLGEVQGAPPSPSDAQRMFGITAQAR